MPLRLPSEGVGISISTHNSKLDFFCDWIEATLLFYEGRISKSEVVDILIEEQLYKDQGFAYQFVSNIWSELRRRVTSSGGNIPIRINRNHVISLRDWREVPGYSFCLLLSLARIYKDWARQFGPDYTEQGELFELFTKESLTNQFDGWVVYHTGWTRAGALKIVDVVENVANAVGENVGSLSPWVNENANEAGLDLVFFRPFKDERAGIPLFLFQCASGINQIGKYYQPDLRIWEKIIEFSASPKKGFSTPFAISNEEHPGICNLVNGFLLDRCRLLSLDEPEEEWISDDLKERIIVWSNPKIETLPSYN